MMARQTIGTTGAAHRSALRVLLGLLALLSLPSDAHASLLSPEAEDKLATFLALFVIFVVPVGLIVLFWMVHILPEKIAHKRHHPQFEAIRTLCLLSLVFGGLLWPFAWLWAYSKPVMYKMAYGTDKHPDSEEFKKEAWPDERQEPAGTLGLSDRLARLEQRGVRSADLSTLRADLDALEARLDAKELR
jgi:CBS domain containing-hemolysin-like protein